MQSGYKKGIEAISAHANKTLEKLLDQDPLLFKTVDSQGASLLHYACGMANVEASKILLAYGCDLHHKDIFGDTPADIARATNFKQYQILDKKAIQEFVEECEKNYSTIVHDQKMFLANRLFLNNEKNKLNVISDSQKMIDQLLNPGAKTTLAEKIKNFRAKIFGSKENNDSNKPQ